MKFETKSLSQCLSLVIDRRGVTPKKLGSDWADTGYRVSSANNVKSSGLQKTDEIRYVNKTTYQKWMHTEIQRDDILLTSEAPAGEVYVWDSDEKIVVGQRLYALRVKEDVNPWFLAFYLQSPKGKAEIKNKCSGSTVFGISAKTFDSIEIVLPDKTIQDHIADVLHNINSKIEINNALSSKLEDFTRMVYDYWFLQFEFPNEEGKPYKSSGGKMVWNEELKREIPEGWEVNELCKVFDITMGSSPKGESLNENHEGIEFYQGSTDFGDLYPVQRVYTTAPVRLAKAQDILISVRAPVGDMNIAMNDCCIGRGLAAVHYRSSLYTWNTLLTLKPYFDIFNGTGTTFGALTSDGLKQQHIVKPSNIIIEKYISRISKIELKLRTITIENQQLTSLRDFLLPLLMNGQVTFKDEVASEEG